MLLPAAQVVQLALPPLDHFPANRGTDTQQPKHISMIAVSGALRRYRWSVGHGRCHRAGEGKERAQQWPAQRVGSEEDEGSVKASLRGMSSIRNGPYPHICASQLLGCYGLTTT